jgi:hypothetical protein
MIIYNMDCQWSRYLQGFVGRWFFANILGKMSAVPAGLTSKQERSFPEMTAKRSISAGGKLNGEIFSKLGPCGREFFDFVGG